MNTFERHKDPKVSIGIGMKAAYQKLTAGSQIKLISDKDFDPELDSKVGDILSIYEVDLNPYTAEEPDSIEIHYFLIDSFGRSTGHSSSWIITPDFFMECFEIVKL